MISAARREARASHKPHNAARAVFVRSAMDRLVENYEKSLRAQGHTVIPEDRPDLLADLRNDPEVKRQLNLAWLPYTPQGFLKILFSRPDRLREAAPRSLADRVDRSHAPRTPPGRSRTCRTSRRGLRSCLGEDAAPAEAKARDDAERRRADVEYAREVIENVDTSGIIRADDLADQARRSRDGRTLAERASSSAAGPTAMSWSTRPRNTPP